MNRFCPQCFSVGPELSCTDCVDEDAARPMPMLPVALWDKMKAAMPSPAERAELDACVCGVEGCGDFTPIATTATEDEIDNAVLFLESMGYDVKPGPETAELVTKAGGAPNGEEVEASKKPYEKPVLVEFGNVRDLTRGAGTKGLDALPVGTRHG